MVGARVAKAQVQDFELSRERFFKDNGTPTCQRLYTSSNLVQVWSGRPAAVRLKAPSLAAAKHRHPLASPFEAVT